MMITLFTIVHYRYHPTPDTRERGGKWTRARGERGRKGIPSLDSYLGGTVRPSGDFPSAAANDRRRQLSIDGCFWREGRDRRPSAAQKPLTVHLLEVGINVGVVPQRPPYAL